MIDLEAVQRDPGMTPLRLAVLVAVVRAAGKPASVDGLARAARVSRSTAFVELAALERDGWISVARGAGRRSVYQSTERTGDQSTKRTPAERVDVASEREQATGPCAGPAAGSPPPGWVDGRPSARTADLCSRWTPRHVWTLHRVPGRAEPLSVRRRVLEDLDGLRVDIGNASTSLDEHVFSRVGRARSSGWFYEKPGVLSLAVWMFDHAPDNDEVAWWTATRAEEQRLLASLRAGTLEVYVSVESPTEGPDRVLQLPAVVMVHPDRRGLGWLRHPVHGRLVEFCVLDLAHAAVLSVGAWSEPTRVSLWPIPSDILATDGKARWSQRKQDEAERRKAEDARRRAEEWAREEQRRWQERIEDILNGRARGAGPPADALELLGLRWPCTEAELKAAHRAAALKHHPDRNPGRVAEATEQMKRVNAAREVIGAAIQHAERTKKAG